MAFEQMRATALEIFFHSLKQANVGAAFKRHIEYSRGVLRIKDDLYNLGDHSRVLVISIGKAAHSMAEALTANLGPLAQGIVVTPEPVTTQIPGFRYFHGGHPLPNEESLRAGDAVMKAVSGMDERALVIFLVSGGGSACLEKPIDAEISLAELIEMNRVLVGSGAPIAEINAIRKHLSALKGGRLAQAASPAQQVSVLVSDVPEDALDSLASGPTMPDASTAEDCYAIADRYGMLKKFPPEVRDIFSHRALEETPKKDNHVFVRSRWWSVLSNATAVDAAAEKARQAGFPVVVDNSCDDQDYAAAADYLLSRLRELQRSNPRVCLISGGEVTVKLPSKSGRGGRNQQFALYCANQIAAENIVVLSAGTDGIDGNSPAAGAVVSGRTLHRFSMLGSGRSMTEAIAAYDAYPVFKQLGDAIEIGPTGNNLRDLRVLLAW